MMWRITELSQEQEQTLEEMALHHPNLDVRKRARGILLLASGLDLRQAALQLNVSKASPYRWGRAWNENGLCGLLGARGERLQPVITDRLVAAAVEIAKTSNLSLSQLAWQLQAALGAPIACSLQTLRVALQREGVSFRSRSIARGGQSRELTRKHWDDCG